jgi:hypothetical protein
LEDEVDFNLLEEKNDVISISAVDNCDAPMDLYNTLGYCYDEEHNYDEDKTLILAFQGGEPMKVIYIEFLRIMPSVLLMG